VREHVYFNGFVIRD